ncbi:MAG: hypothetical protein NXI27_02400 [Alphaproteobacteria bacterium]|nr:hypothetical protein [Alphaproteobacteria bacterium]
MAEIDRDDEAAVPRPGQVLRIGKWHFQLPKNRLWRTLLGVAFILGGIVGFLPIVGFWMIPVGLLILSNDIPMIRRWRRRLIIWAGRRKNNNRNGKNAPR